MHSQLARGKPILDHQTTLLNIFFFLRRNLDILSLFFFRALPPQHRPRGGQIRRDPRGQQRGQQRRRAGEGGQARGLQGVGGLACEGRK